MNSSILPTGHRERLRNRFLSDPNSFSEEELLELLLTYAIPRRDVQQISKSLLIRYGNINTILSNPIEQLKEIDGIGDNAAILINIISRIKSDYLQGNHSQKVYNPGYQPSLFHSSPQLDLAINSKSNYQIRSFVDDEICNILKFIPQAIDFESVESYKNYLIDNLPYNSQSTRQRRASYIINRYFHNDFTRIPLTIFASKTNNQDGLKSALFYETLKSEALIAKFSEELIWGSLPIGYLNQQQIKDFVQYHLPDLGDNSFKKVYQALSNVYTLLSNSTRDGNSLRFNIHQGTLEGFLYVLTAEYPNPGIYSFDSLYNGRLQHWMLWDKDWIRLQLYNLQDFGILSKVSEIDNIRQFTIQLNQIHALEHYLNHPKRHTMAIRDI
jgi:hypothetical protein